MTVQDTLDEVKALNAMMREGGLDVTFVHDAAVNGAEIYWEDEDEGVISLSVCLSDNLATIHVLETGEVAFDIDVAGAKDIVARKYL